MGFPLFYSQKNPGLSRTPMKNFPGPFRSPRMFKYEEKMAFTYNIQSAVRCRRFSMKQNVDISCSELRWTYLHMVIWTSRKMHDFQGYFPGLSKTLSFKFQDQSDFPGLSRFRNFQEKNPGLSRRRGNPASAWESEWGLTCRSTHYRSFQRRSSRQSLALARSTAINCKINQNNTKKPQNNNILPTYTCAQT